jgi:hypothetical protein
MPVNPRVKSVTVRKDYTLPITFANGEEKLFDVKPYLETGVFKSLKNVAMFTTAHAEYGTVVWQNNVDFDPDTLYLESKKAVPTTPVV